MNKEATMNSPGDRDKPPEDALRLAFVEMMFALAVAEVATKAADFVNAGIGLSQLTPAMAHLSLALLVIAASWVGWRQSVSPGMKDKVEFVFTWPFVGLLVDVLIVILYFMLARNVDAIKQGQGPATLIPSARPESVLLCVIFAVYALWDFIADMLQKGTWQRISSISEFWRATVASMFCSLVCLLLCASMAWLTWNESKPFQVAIVDIGLICVVLFFRALKPIEGSVAKRLGVSDICEFTKNRNSSGNERAWRAMLIVGYIASAILVVCV